MCFPKTRASFVGALILVAVYGSAWAYYTWQFCAVRYCPMAVYMRQARAILGVEDHKSNTFTEPTTGVHGYFGMLDDLVTTNVLNENEEEEMCQQGDIFGTPDTTLVTVPTSTGKSVQIKQAWQQTLSTTGEKKYTLVLSFYLSHFNRISLIKIMKIDNDAIKKNGRVLFRTRRSHIR